jgi:hypothetical protein
MQALSCGYYMFFLSVLLALWVLWFAAGRWSLRTTGGAALAFGAAALLLAPILLDYQAILRDTYGFSRSIDEIRIFSADVAGLLLASEDLLLWGWLHLVQRAGRRSSQAWRWSCSPDSPSTARGRSYSMLTPRRRRGSFAPALPRS